MNDLTHDDIGRAVVHWFHRQGWCHMAAQSVAYGDGIPDVLATASPFRPINEQHRSAAEARTDAQTAGWSEVQALYRPRFRALYAAHKGRHKWPRGDPRVTAYHEAHARLHDEREAAVEDMRATLPSRLGPPVDVNAHRARLAVVEVKRNRSDLLQDLKRGKMLKYERVASHCYLALHPSCLKAELQGPNQRALLKEQQLVELEDLGLPVHWGVMLVTEAKTPTPRSIRSARVPKGKERPSASQLYGAAVAIGRSLAYRYAALEERLARGVPDAG